MGKRLLAILAGLGAALGLAGVAAAWANYTTPYSWGDGGTVLLLDGGPKTSNTVMLQNPWAGTTCTSNATGVVTLYGSNDGVNLWQVGAPLGMDGGTNTYAWDIVSGLEYLTVGFDAGASTKGFMTCTTTQKGTTP